MRSQDILKVKKLTIRELEVGNKGTVEEIKGNKEIQLKLRELGIFPGTEIEVIIKDDLNNIICLNDRVRIIVGEELLNYIFLKK